MNLLHLLVSTYHDFQHKKIGPGFHCEIQNWDCLLFLTTLQKGSFYLEKFKSMNFRIFDTNECLGLYF